MRFPALLTFFLFPFAYAQNAPAFFIQPGPNVQEEAQEALILAEPGAVIEFDEGVFEFTMGLSLDARNVTVRGKGMDKTILSFKNQNAGSEGLLVTSSGVTLEDFAVEDSPGDAIKAKGCGGITMRRLRAEWTGGPKETNGAYGLYPVESTNVVIENCVVRGASDAGIYVGQSKNVIVRRNRAEYNVAGIEIENCHGADVYENTATRNTGGVLVFDLPDLPMQRGRDVRVFDNQIVGNDTPNFAPEGNIVGTVPTGTGLMIMANSNVEVFGNTFDKNQTASLLIVSYHSTGRKVNDPNYYPYPEAIHIHHNRFGEGGMDPQGVFGAVIAKVTGVPVPAIVWDGARNRELLVDGELPADKRIYIHSNEGADFINIDMPRSLIVPERANVSRDISKHAGELPRVPPVVIEGAAG